MDGFFITKLSVQINDNLLLSLVQLSPSNCTILLKDLERVKISKEITTFQSGYIFYSLHYFLIKSSWNIFISRKRIHDEASFVQFENIECFISKCTKFNVCVCVCVCVH